MRYCGGIKTSMFNIEGLTLNPRPASDPMRLPMRNMNGQFSPAPRID